jgi:hypothetical protein
MDMVIFFGIIKYTNDDLMEDGKKVGSWWKQTRQRGKLIFGYTH